MARIGVLGGGRWGTALSLHLARQGHQVLVFDIKSEVVESLRRGQNPYWEDVDTPKGIDATTELLEVIGFSQVLLLALPVQSIREALKDVDLNGKKVVSASKGLEVETSLRVSQILKEISPHCEVMCLSGPSFAREVAKGLPTAVVLAGEEEESLRYVQSLFFSPYFRVYLSTDLVGVELGGSLKNVVAIACGVSDGLGFGDNARAALITRGLAEMVRLGEKLGAKRETFYGLSGLGDLVLTATSSQSRNYTLGYLLGKGHSLSSALEKIGQVVEGVHTVMAVVKLSQELDVRAPISYAVYRLLQGEDPLQVAHQLLMNPPPHREFE
ncbi:Glycerol-3-phosphate dehydrogenase (NAD(P)(+)) [Thermocrinis albus DSM 14484]|uniref:Glycerol-3-phosphate dehydrogenase [NAD(P)+] n=1 Tax=Thermocrinis albus (strain DSM 14484 / JCM 11386 / HI 11/12) TaxID=638303 RepID=D3SNL8_THEAH|nr:NAD(P)H-dependent glycerol-3-phosphate dehydrogenase [Thermocrinis albus]ADC88755.1 Glycerol-3-phosphate dehydrogenase (NAD(P)(+)) [Thermocrinis albus DSM 14484]